MIEIHKIINNIASSNINSLVHFRENIHNVGNFQNLKFQPIFISLAQLL